MHWKQPVVFFSLVSDNHPTLVIMGMNMFDDFWGIAKENWLHIGWHLSKSPYLALGILKALKNQESFFMFVFRFWNIFVKLQKFAQKNIGCNYIWGLAAGGWQHFIWSKSKELSFLFDSKTLENMQFFIKESVNIWWFNVHFLFFSKFYFMEMWLYTRTKLSVFFL